MGEPKTVALSDNLDMNAAGPLTASLRAARGAPVALDASAVRRVGGQCLQVLLSAQATWAADGKPFEIVSPSPEFAEGLALMGAADLASDSSVQD
ncbi:MAG: STAS domain-containing protein [Phenylobacterium sp.]|uniref:STAS domain-containing protein n=1 Tax=Phenylobacterium sp. TaxID=1871053 RepID=UPI0025CCF0F4|nr:STAS domain-containing protein [Phenylobacterium sp.]MBI1199861.1 STAS domain-containing protein [Phenylobacterium sp.]